VRRDGVYNPSSKKENVSQLFFLSFRSEARNLVWNNYIILKIPHPNISGFGMGISIGKVLVFSDRF